MINITTAAKTNTGQLLYSDVINTYDYDSYDEYGTYQRPLLNKLSYYPGVSTFSGLFRCCLAIVHIAIHLFEFIRTGDVGHLGHALKGLCEFTRGCVEAVPVLGSIISYLVDNPPFESMVSTRGIITYRHSWLISLDVISEEEWKKIQNSCW